MVNGKRALCRVIFTSAILGFTTVAALAAAPVKQPPVPQGWRRPSKTEVGQEWRRSDPNKYLLVKADFNSDGRLDQATLLLRDNTVGLGLFAFIAQKNGTFKTYLLDAVEEGGYLEVMGIKAAPPGSYRTACGKGYFDCQEGEPENIALRRPAIDYFKEESANSFFYWDREAGTFKRVWMSD